MKQRSILLKLHNLSSFEMNQDREEAPMNTSLRNCGAENQFQCTTTSFPKSSLDGTEPSKMALPSLVEFQECEMGDISDEIGCDWAMSDDSMDENAIQTITPLAADLTSSMYSLFFEEENNNNNNNMEQDHDDDNSVSLHDDVVLEEADFCLEGMKENPDAFWACDPVMTQERRFSPAVISVSSEAANDLLLLDAL